MADPGFNTLGLLVVAASVGFVVIAAVTVTSFIKISVVLFLLRNALGVQQVPPNIVLYAVALILTGFISLPVARQAYAGVASAEVRPQTAGEWITVGARAEEPLRGFLQKFTTAEERGFFFGATSRLWPEPMREQATPDDLMILVPSFMVSELRRGFEIGVLIYLPFITIDLVITTILMAMGMSQVQPTLISIPLKLFLFVTVSGWTRLMHGLVLSYV